MSLCPFNGFEPCPEACAFAAEDAAACMLVDRLAAIASAVSSIAETRHAMGEQTVMQLAPVPVTCEEWAAGRGASHYVGMTTKAAYIEFRRAQGRGEVVADAMPQRTFTNLVLRCHPALYVDNARDAVFRMIGGVEND